ncbi:MAG: hypothetical protein LBV33_04770 [Lachnospiraceae bacterium]|jgi:membrane-associated HD superfamily phosphohydrolase|nr:hypothetical protein [Lachnospiraceae bacterium]
MKKIKPTLISLFLFIITGGVTGGVAYLYDKTPADIIRITIMALVGAGAVLFLSAEGREKNSLFHDNAQHFGRFAVFYSIGLIGAVLCPLLPVAGWPYPVIFIMMALLSNQITGLVAGSTFLLISVMLEQTGSGLLAHEFFMYWVSGLVGVIIFAYLDENFKVGLPILITLMIFTVCLVANDVMAGTGGFTFERGFIILANILMCILILLVFLRYYITAVLYKYRDKYMEINDPECPILVELKQKSKAEYYQAVHTAYLSDKIARRLGLDDAVAKTCGYYHKIGTLQGGNSWEAILDICKQYSFPPPAIALLKEYTDKESFLVSKEAVVVLFADTLVSSILYLFSKDPKVSPDYNSIIEAIYLKKVDGGILDKSAITLGELKEMKKLLMEEKLYYDFLR